MKLNPDGTVKVCSVREAKRVFLRPKEGQSIRYHLALARRGRVRPGEIAVLGDREWLRVNPVHFHGTAWIEII